MNFEDRRKQLLVQLQQAQSNLGVARSQVQNFEIEVTRIEGAVIEMNFQIAEETKEKEEAAAAAKAKKDAEEKAAKEAGEAALAALAATAEPTPGLPTS